LITKIKPEKGLSHCLHKTID